MTDALGDLPPTPASPTWSTLLDLGESQCRAAATLREELAESPLDDSWLSVDTSDQAPVRRGSVGKGSPSGDSDASLLEQQWGQIQHDLMMYRQARQSCLETGTCDFASLQQGMTTDDKNAPSASASYEAASRELWNTLMHPGASNEMSSACVGDQSLAILLPRSSAVHTPLSNPTSMSQAPSSHTARDAATSFDSIVRPSAAGTGLHAMSPVISAAFAEREGQTLSDLHSARSGQMEAGTKSSVDLKIKPVTSLRPVCTISTLVLTSQKHTPAALSSKVQPSNLEGGTSSRPASLIAKSQNKTVCSPTLTLFDTDTPLPSPSLWSPAPKGPTSPVRDRRRQSGSATSLSEQCWTPVGLRPRERDTYASRKVHEDKGGQREGLLSLVDMLSIIEPEEKSPKAVQRHYSHQARSTDGNAARLLKRTYSLTLSRQHRAQSRAGKRSEDTLYEDRDALGLPQPTPSHSPTKTSWPLVKAYDALRDREAPVIPLIKAAAATKGRIPARETQRDLRGSARNLTRQSSLRIFSRPGTPGRSI